MKNWKTLDPDVYALVAGNRFTPGRPRPIDRIVIHHNAGVNLTTEDVRRIWIDREASAHYQVEPNGRIGQLVHDKDTAWHAAIPSINARSIGIEHANIGGPPRWQISDATVEAGAHLVAALCHAYKLGRPQWGRNVFPHSQYAQTSCPAQLAPGGEDHVHYMARAAWWFDHPDDSPTPSPKVDAMTPEQFAVLVETRDNTRDNTREILRQLGQPGGHPQGGKRTLYDLASAIAEVEGVPNTRDTLG